MKRPYKKTVAGFEIEHVTWLWALAVGYFQRMIIVSEIVAKPRTTETRNFVSADTEAAVVELLPTAIVPTYWMLSLKSSHIV